ncbi:MAG TPA: sigma-70 family RNA polymerase sigma factor [Solirubrobacteraceae bacterium]|nr:sigma-70 family RNA polymerase sigma factor [Solirubrobacteraceae bacterium]
MDEREWLTERFEPHRPHLRAVAYRMLGSVSESDDAVQEAWLRVRDQDPGAVENMQAWLTTVVGRVCLNMLRARRARREKLSAHVLDPVVSFEEDGPERDALLADSVGLALLVVLDALTPAERLAFVLHDVFGLPFADIAAALVNGATGAVVAPHGGVFSVMAFTVANGKIVQIDALLDPERLEQLDLTIPPTAD